MFKTVYSPFNKKSQPLQNVPCPIVLGINVTMGNFYSHNSSAALINNGEILALCEQERFDRIKESGRFPLDAIKACFEISGLSIHDVDAISLAMDPYFVSNRIGIQPDHNLFFLVYQNILNAFGYVPDCLILVNHHLSHAASSFYMSGFNESLIISWDGGGDNQHTVVYKGGKKGIIQICEHPYSLGNLYNKFKIFLNLSDKGSLMGLASYANKQNGELKEFIDSEEVRIDPGLQFSQGGEYITDERILKTIGKPRLPGEPVDQTHAEIAGQVQHAVESLCFSIVDKALNKYSCSNLCLAGGVALNATFNGLLWREKQFDHIYIQPNATDGGLSLGSALEGVRLLSGQNDQFKIMNHCYYGPSFEDDEIKTILTTCGIKAEYISEEMKLLDRVVSWIEQGSVVGWFQGRMEWGPRALGNRSILADPRSSKIADKVNQIIKYRDEWRPFALSILADHADSYLIDPHYDPFMITTAPVREEKKEMIAGVTHADGTTRPQFVLKETNSRYHNLLCQFHKKTGVPGLLNTSFNLKGEPIVCSPRDALRTFFSSGLEYLVMGNWVVHKSV